MPPSSRLGFENSFPALMVRLQLFCRVSQQPEADGSMRLELVVRFNLANRVGRNFRPSPWPGGPWGRRLSTTHQCFSACIADPEAGRGWTLRQCGRRHRGRAPVSARKPTGSGRGYPALDSAPVHSLAPARPTTMQRFKACARFTRGSSPLAHKL